jgi:hypothetical protein
MFAVKTEADVYAFPPRTPQTPPTQSSPSCGYTQPHHLVFKQPHPPIAMPGTGPFDPYGHPVTPATSRPNSSEILSHQPQHHQSPHQPASAAQGTEAFHHQSPGSQMPDQFMHQQSFRPSSGSPVITGSRPALQAGEPGMRQFQMFHSPNTSPSPRFNDPFGGHVVKGAAEQPTGPGQEHYTMMSGTNVSGVHQQHSDASYAQYGVTRSPSEQYPRPGMNMREMYAVNPAMMSDPYARSHVNPRSAATADPYCRPPMTPSPSDPSLRPPMSQKSMPPEHYGVMIQRDPYSHAPMTPAPSDPYARPPMTPAPADQCARPPMAPTASDPYARPPMTPAPSDAAYARPPMTPVSGDPYARPPMTPVSSDAYTRPPMTPRAAVADAYATSPSSSDPYVRPPMTPRPMMAIEQRPHMSATPAQTDPYARPPMTPHPASAEPCPPRPGMPLESFCPPGGGRVSAGAEPADGQTLGARPAFSGESGVPTQSSPSVCNIVCRLCGMPCTLT